MKDVEEPKLTSAEEKMQDAGEEEHKTLERIKNFVKYQKFYDVKKVVTNRVAHCGSCRREIGKTEERIVVNPNVVSQRFLLCPDCMQIYFEERKNWINSQADEFTMSDSEYEEMMEKYKSFLKGEFTATELYVDGHSSVLEVKLGNRGVVLLEDNPTTDTPIGHDLEAVLLAVLNLIPKAEVIVYTNNNTVASLLNNCYKYKSRRNEELIQFVKLTILKKELDIVFKYMHGL